MIWGVKTNPYFWKDPDLHYTYCGYPVGIVTYQILPEMEDLNIPNCLHPRKRLRMSGAKNSKRKGLNVSQVTIFQGTFVSFWGEFFPTVDGSEIRLYNQLRLVVYTTIYKVLAPSLVVQDFFHQQYVIPWNYPPPPGL